LSFPFGEKTIVLKEVQSNAVVMESKPMSLRRNFSWMLIGNIIFGGCQWAMLSVLAKVTNPETVGKFTLALAITAPVIMFAALNLRSVLVTDTKQQYSFNEYIALRLLALAAAFVVIVGITLVSGASLETALVIIFVTVAKIFDSLSDILYALQQHHEQMDNIAISRILQGILQLLTLGIVFRLTGSLVWATAVMAGASGLITLIYDIPYTARVGAFSSQQKGRWLSRRSLNAIAPSWNFTAIRALARLAAPLGVVAVLGIVTTSTPRYFLAYYLSQREVGLFSAMWSLFFPILLIAGSVVQALIPRMARYYQEDIRQFKNLLKKMLAVSVLCGIIGVLIAHFAGRVILTLLFGSEYAQHPTVFVWIMVAAGLYYISVPFNQTVICARSFNVQPLIHSVTLIVTLISGIVLIPRYGLLGAAWVMCASMGTLLVGLAIASLYSLSCEQRRQAA